MLNYIEFIDLKCFYFGKEIWYFGPNTVPCAAAGFRRITRCPKNAAVSMDTFSQNYLQLLFWSIIYISRL